ncbi:MAG: elongation factor G [Candidatus Marinimicrobia bacterium]|nr:elongation factor G [Candidatus Neomarinimicrobiota bacterium]
MKEYQTNEIRNVGLFGHASSGKTSLAEAFLYTAGVTTRLGKIEDGTTVSDYHQDEIARKFSISTSLMHVEWDKIKINILDTPGYLDFISESKAIAKVVDLGLILVHSQTGVEVGTEMVFKFSEEENLPVWFIINMLDREHSNFKKTVESIRNTFGKKAVPIQIPVNEGLGFTTIVDLIKEKALKYNPDSKGDYSIEDIPDNLKQEVDELREDLIETIAESDDSLLEKFFENGTLSEEEIINGLKNAVINREIFPILASSAAHNIDAKRILELIKDFAPAPNERGEITGFANGKEIKRKVSDSEPVSIYIFKTLSELHVGELLFFKVMSGCLKSGLDLLNPHTKTTERIGTIYITNGKNKNEVAHLHAGDLGSTVKLKNSHTLDTLTDPKSPIEYQRVTFPDPVIEIAIEPKSRGDEEKISEGLQALNHEDPTFNYRYDSELKQTILSGQGELHLMVVLDRLKARYNVEVNQMPPRIPYRETITKKGEAKYRHKKQTGGAGQFAEVWMYIEPLERGKGIEFTNTLVGQNVDRVFVPSVEKGVRSACEEGIMAGYKVTDVKAVFYDGKQHPVDSNDISFQIAGKGAFKECFINANPILLEPIYELEILVPEEFMGDVMGDISSRRGKILGIETEGNFQKIKAQVPLAELYKYGSALRSMTQGRGYHRQKFSHYETVPREIQDKIIEEAKRKKEEAHK